MPEPKKSTTPDTPEATKAAATVFYYPDANDGKGGTVLADTKEQADKLAQAGKFVTTNEADQAREDAE